MPPPANYRIKLHSASNVVLIVGSGMSYHNLRGFGAEFGAASDEFDHWLTDAVCAPDAATRNEKLEQWQTAPHARLAPSAGRTAAAADGGRRARQAKIWDVESSLIAS